MLDSLMHDDGAGIHAVAGDGGAGLGRERIGDWSRVNDHGTGFVGDPDQVDTRPNRNQISGRGSAWNEHKIAGPGG